MSMPESVIMIEAPNRMAGKNTTSSRQAQRINGA
jgi:hypothetical protein